LTEGIGLDPGYPQEAYSKLGTTTNSSAMSTGSPITSIPVSALSAAIPAGNIVLATTQNPPAHFQVFSTSGAAEGATSIPVTSQTPNYAYPDSSLILNDYAGPFDCGNIAQYAAGHGLAGVMFWTVQDDYLDHNKQYPCFNLVAPYVPPAP
jgi:hypothetical protein